MKRKIAAIFAADIAGYSRLVAEDEEETLRRLASYRQVTDDFIAKGGGRIFNIAGDAVLAEFPSAVEAVRSAIDIQESLRPQQGLSAEPADVLSHGHHHRRRGRKRRRPAGRRRQHRGAPADPSQPGGLAISKWVQEQVAGKVRGNSAISAPKVKNMPAPVHAYMVAMRRHDDTYATPQIKKVAKASHGTAELDVAAGRHWRFVLPRSGSAAFCISPSLRRRRPRLWPPRAHGP